MRQEQITNEVTCFRSGGMTFVATPDLHQVCTSASDWAKRCNRKDIEAVDLLLALYYGARTEVSDLLQLAVPMVQLDGAALEHWHDALAGSGSEGGFGTTARAVLGTTAELGAHYRGFDAERVAMITSADLAVALLNDVGVKHALRKAGVSETHLRHLEQALRLQERQPVNPAASINTDSSARADASRTIH